MDRSEEYLVCVVEALEESGDVPRHSIINNNGNISSTSVEFDNSISHVRDMCDVNTPGDTLHLINSENSVELTTNLPRNKIIESGEYIYFECVTCKQLIEVKKSEINCKIFRCGQFKATGEPIPPHSSYLTCKQYVDSGLVFGCGEAMELLGDYIVKCDHSR